MSTTVLQESSETRTSEQEPPPPPVKGDGEENPELLALVSAFAGGDGDDDEAGEDEISDGGETPKSQPMPKDLNGLAETLGVEVKELYALSIPSAREGEKPYTLGKLKDIAADIDDFNLRNLKFDERVRKTEGDMLRAQQELRTLVEALPEDALKPEVLKAVREKHEAELKAERARTLEVISDWGDEETERQDRAGMAEHLSEYGFPENMLDTISDHKTLRYVRENYLREKRLRKVLEGVKERRTQTPGRSGRSETKPARKGRTTSDESRVREFLSAIKG